MFLKSTYSPVTHTVSPLLFTKTTTDDRHEKNASARTVVLNQNVATAAALAAAASFDAPDKFDFAVLNRRFTL